MAPTRGWILDLQGGAGIPGASTRGFGRVVARSAAWYPLSRDWQLSGKLEGGAVFGASRQQVPSALLFRTGGDTTVRGYSYESLGVKDGDATVAGTLLCRRKRRGDALDQSDVGVSRRSSTRATRSTSFRDFKVAFGYGVGARVRTPIGPFRFDIAYGQESRQVRIHFSVGLAF